MSLCDGPALVAAGVLGSAYATDQRGAERDDGQAQRRGGRNRRETDKEPLGRVHGLFPDEAKRMRAWCVGGGLRSVANLTIRQDGCARSELGAAPGGYSPFASNTTFAVSRINRRSNNNTPGADRSK